MRRSKRSKWKTNQLMLKLDSARSLLVADDEWLQSLRPYSRDCIVLVHAAHRRSSATAAIATEIESAQLRLRLAVSSHLLHVHQSASVCRYSIASSASATAACSSSSYVLDRRELEKYVVRRQTSVLQNRDVGIFRTLSVNL